MFKLKNEPIIPNPIIDTSYVGLYYAFPARGGFQMEQGFETILLFIPDEFTKFDFTTALQVYFDVRTFNEKLGLFKAANNIDIISTTYDPDTDSFPTDSITITAEEFLNGMSADQVISVGTYSTLYTDFINDINMYFGFPAGIDSVFNATSIADFNGGVFNGNTLMQIMSGQLLDPSGSGVYINDLSGSITISNINMLLREAVAYNVFGNRRSTPTKTYNVGDGFIQNDLFFVPAGVTITLRLSIDAVDNHDCENINCILCDTPQTEYLNITRTINAPLGIKLKNLS